MRAILDFNMKNKHTNPETPEVNASVSRPKSVLEAFEYIVEMAESSNLNAEFMAKAAVSIKYASRKLKLSAMQTVLLALFVDRSEDRRIMMSELARYTGCRTTKFLRLIKDIDELENRNYVVASRSDNSVSYHVPMEVLNALRSNVPYVRQAVMVEDTYAFFQRFRRLARMMDRGEINHDKLLLFTNEALEQIERSTFAMKLRACGMDEETCLLFIFMAHLYVINEDDHIVFSDIEDIYDDEDIPGWIQRGLRNRNSDLFEKQLIENANEDGMGRTDAFKLTDKAKTEFLCELNLNSVAKTVNGLEKHESLAKKELIYNEAENRQIEELFSILSPERFGQVQERMKAAGMRAGFCCLFYGAPGTGKTETVYQLARRTGRDIMRVDVDKIKSCWVGESEKNIKALFDRYRNICRNAERAPILLFNEADAVLGVRMEGAARAVDKMENSIQNIILQEMESLEGIMIATTNLTTNLDKAFERRFLYKIRYEKPDVESRSRIWQIMLPGLKPDAASTLAGNFDLSGGEIENIVRRHTVKTILDGSELIDVDALAELCRRERIASSRVRMGF